MNKILPYLYFLIAGFWLAEGAVTFFKDPEVYHIFLSYNTTNKYGFLAFKLIVGIVVILAGLRRLKMVRES